MENQGIRLSKALAQAGVASRRKCEELIFEGKVTVNGKLILKPEHHVNPQRDTLEVDGELIKPTEEKIYLLFNKPKGYICSNKPLPGKKLVVDLFKDLPYRLFTVGRLDRDTTGLILVTNDGKFAQEVIHPSRGFDKEYLIKTEQEITAEHLITLSKGGLVEGVWIKPKKVAKVRKGTLKVVVSEGKKREVRLLVKKAGLTLLSLHRIRIGPLTLGSLPIGASRELTPAELEAFLARD